MSKFIKYPNTFFTKGNFFISSIDKFNYISLTDLDFCIEFINHINKHVFLELFLDGKLSFDLLTKDVIKHLEPSSVYMNKFSSSKFITDEFVRNNIDKLNWDIISISFTFFTHAHINTKDFIAKYANLLDLDIVLNDIHMDEDFLIRHSNKIDFRVLSENGQTFSDKFYDKYHDKLDWNLIVKCSQLKEDILLKYIFKMNINDIIAYQLDLSDNFFYKYGSRISFIKLLNLRRRVSEDFLITNIKKLNESCINVIINKYPHYSRLIYLIGLDKIEKDYWYDIEFAQRYGLTKSKNVTKKKKNYLSSTSLARQHCLTESRNIKKDRSYDASFVFHYCLTESKKMTNKHRA